MYILELRMSDEKPRSDSEVARERRQWRMSILGENTVNSGLLSGYTRGTSLGMFMPYEEDEDDVVAAGLLGKAVNAVNTARDTEHVIRVILKLEIGKLEVGSLRVFDNPSGFSSSRGGSRNKDFAMNSTSGAHVITPVL